MGLEHLKGRQFIASFSGGKDSTLAIYRAQQVGGRLAGLITTVDKHRQSSYSHCLTSGQLSGLAASMNTTLHLIETDADHYRQDFIACLQSYKEAGVELAVFGDIDIDEHRAWVEGVCREAGVEALFPLWQQDRRQIVEEFILEGFRAVIKVVNLAFLDTSFLGRTLTRDMLSEFEQKSIDVCGENGEYHTMVCDGPIFTEAFRFAADRIVVSDGYGILVAK